MGGDEVRRRTSVEGAGRMEEKKPERQDAREEHVCEDRAPYVYGRGSPGRTLICLRLVQGSNHIAKSTTATTERSPRQQTKRIHDKITSL